MGFVFDVGSWESYVPLLSIEGPSINRILPFTVTHVLSPDGGSTLLASCGQWRQGLG